MKKLLYILVLVLVLTGCGKTETDNSKQVKIEEDKKSVEEDVTSEKEILDAEDVSGATNAEDSQSTANTTVVQEPSNNASSNNDTTTGTNNTGSTTKPSTGSTNNNSGSTNNSANAGFTGSAGSTGNTSNNNSGTTTQPSTPVHEHKWVEVTEEEIHYYAWRTICNVCGTDLTDMTVPDKTYHVGKICGGSYAAYYKEVDFVTESIVKIPVVTGYKCECGAEK